MRLLEAFDRGAALTPPCTDTYGKVKGGKLHTCAVGAIALGLLPEDALIDVMVAPIDDGARHELWENEILGLWLHEDDPFSGIPAVNDSAGGDRRLVREFLIESGLAEVEL